MPETQRPPLGIPTLVVDLVDPNHPLASATVSIRTAEKFCRLLCDLPETADLDARLQWLAELGAWLHAPPLARGARPLNPARVEFLLRVMQLYPQWRAAVGELIAGALAELPAVRLFAEAGLPTESGFAAETMTRLGRRALPPRRRDLGGVLERLLAGEDDAAWLDRLDAPMLEGLAAFLAPLLARAPALRDELAGALNWVALRASNLGLARDVRQLAGARVHRSPFVLLPVRCTELAGSDDEGAHARFAESLDDCRRELELARAGAEQASVSLDLLYRLGLAEQLLERLEHLARVLAQDDTPLAVAQLLASVVRGQQRRRQLRGLLASSTRQLGQRIADCAGHYGEHHLPQTRAEQARMLLGSAGGGFLTAFTTVLKLAIARFALAPLFEGLAVSFDYAGSFLAMQLCGFSLATKQTALMAAAMIRAIKRADPPDELARTGARVVRTLASGVVGNATVVVLSAVALDAAWRALFGHHLVDAAQAEHIVGSLHPWKSGTAPFAFVTGVFLWVSSLAAGWFQNWATFRRVPEALPAGAGPLTRLFRALAGNPAGTAASVSLGSLMGMVPVLARFCGLTLEVRHVTLSSGALALAGCTVGRAHLLDGSFLAAIGGICVIAVMNFGVSFALSFGVALRAQGLAELAPRGLAAEIWRALVRAPEPEVSTQS